MWLVDLRATWLQYRLWRSDPSNTALTSRFRTGVILMVLASLAAAFAAASLLRVNLPPGTRLDLLVAFLAGTSIPQLLWLIEWWRGFR